MKCLNSVIKLSPIEERMGQHVKSTIKTKLSVPITDVY